MVEFLREPTSLGRFAEALDRELRACNSDYDAKRRTTLDGGPLHGLHEPEEGPVHKTGGSDNYYNNGLYPGWALPM